MSGGFIQQEELSSSDEARQNSVNEQTKRLRRHLGLGESPGLPASSTPPACTVLFFIEIAPHSRHGAKCNLPSCSGRIEPGQYRLALTPGMSGPAWLHPSDEKPDLYHLGCFEKIADLSQSDFLDRIEPVTRSTFLPRGLKGMQIVDGDYLCDGGAERLILEWKFRRGKWIDRRNGVEREPLDPAFNNLLRRAGSSTFAYQQVPGITIHEWSNLMLSLAPFESDGPGDTQEWNLFASYLNADDNEASLYERHDLSEMLQCWESDTELCSRADHILTDQERQAKTRLGEKAVRAVKRLSAIPMPDFQSAFLGRSNIF